jgi:sigma-B regulation protein RsbU (phosphoserine phosphatase)
MTIIRHGRNYLSRGTCGAPRLQLGIKFAISIQWKIAERLRISMNILVVDDAPEVLAWLAALLRNDGWHVYQAADAATACRLLEAEDIRVVITDWMMPGMDGLSLIDWIRQRGTDPYIYTLLMTSRDREDDCIRGLESGADDYLVKPVTAGVLRARLKTARRITEMQQVLLDQQKRLSESRRMVASAFAGVKHELRQAASQQRAALPGGLQLPDGIRADFRFRPATSLSGDHLDFFLLGKNQLAFYLLDVSGHGVGAALRSAALVELMRPFSSVMHGLATEGPHRVLEALNRHICESSKEVEYLATIVLGLLDTQSGALQICSAGHPSPLAIRARGSINELTTSGLPLGVTPEARYEVCTAQLEPGDSLLLYSDGVPDCLSESGEAIGNVALHRQVRASSGCAPDVILDGLDARLKLWRGQRPLEDDVSLLAIGLQPDESVTVVKDLPAAAQRAAS